MGGYLFRTIRDHIYTILFASLAIVFLHYFVLQPYRVSSNAMAPLYTEGDILLINRLPVWNKPYTRNDVIVYRDNGDASQKHLSQIIGLPGERISINDGILLVEGSERIQKELPLFGSVAASRHNFGLLDAHEYYVLSNASPEENAGMVDVRDILGCPTIKIWPISY